MSKESDRMMSERIRRAAGIPDRPPKKMSQMDARIRRAAGHVIPPEMVEGETKGDNE